MKILIGYDGTKTAKEALNLGREHAKAFGASVIIVTSKQEGKQDQREVIEQAESRLEWAKSIFETDGLQCSTHLLIRGLSAGEDLVLFAEENGVSEVIVGVRRRSKVGKLLMGSTAQYIILNASCPVVAVK